MKSKKYKILVLSDLKKTTNSTLKCAVSLANIVNGDISVFHVKKGTDIVKKDNQLSAIRTINQDYNKTEKQISNLITPIAKDYGVKINYSYSFGNVKDEIGRYINEYKPDIIVLGKRKAKAIKVLGDNITQFVLKKQKGAIMIANSQNILEPNQNFSIGLLNGADESSLFPEVLISHTQKPLKIFKILKNSDSNKQEKVNTDKNTIEYVFEHNDNAIENLSKYLQKSNINILCVDRENKEKSNKVKSKNLDINKVIDKVSVSLLVAS